MCESPLCRLVWSWELRGNWWFKPVPANLAGCALKGLELCNRNGKPRWYLVLNSCERHVSCSTTAARSRREWTGYSTLWAHGCITVLGCVAMTIISLYLLCCSLVQSYLCFFCVELCWAPVLFPFVQPLVSLASTVWWYVGERGV